MNEWLADEQHIALTAEDDGDPVGYIKAEEPAARIVSRSLGMDVPYPPIQ